jgi:hypothetical protein
MTPREVMLEELQGQRERVVRERHAIEFDLARLDGEDEVLSLLAARLESGMIRLVPDGNKPAAVMH